jgi:hypothetical protein
MERRSGLVCGNNQIRSCICLDEGKQLSFIRSGDSLRLAPWADRPQRQPVDRPRTPHEIGCTEHRFIVSRMQGR